jgi:hypothetical protein
VIEGDRLMGGVPTIFAKGPTSASAAFPEPVEPLSLSSPVTKVLNFAQTEPVTFSMLGLEIQEDDPSPGDWRRRLEISSSSA